MIKGLGHLAIRAKDIEATAKFYCEVIGFKEAFRMNHLEGGRLGGIYLYVCLPGATALFALYYQPGYTGGVYFAVADGCV